MAKVLQRAKNTYTVLVTQEDKDYFCDIDNAKRGGFQDVHRWLESQFKGSAFIPACHFDGTHYHFTLTREGAGKITKWLHKYPRGGYVDRVRKVFGAAAADIMDRK